MGHLAQQSAGPDGGRSISGAAKTYLPRPRTKIKGGKGVRGSFFWQSAPGIGPPRICMVVFVSSIAGYP